MYQSMEYDGYKVIINTLPSPITLVTDAVCDKDKGKMISGANERRILLMTRVCSNVNVST